MKNFFIILITLSGWTTYAQIQKGIVVDSDGNPLENAYINNISSESHAHTNEFGMFSIDKTVAGNVLKVNALGFKKINYTVSGSEIRITLEDAVFRLNEIVIQPKLSAMNVISKIDLLTTPVNSSQEILRKVPGLFIGQHAGGGKAEQLFLRGFDIDHGTDIAISVDGMPVNMVSHAHGQGYADLHFVIPETVEKIDFGKGTYYANKGDFATAGYVAFQTKDKLEKSSIGLEVGQFNTVRTVGLFNLLGSQKKQSAYIATEYILTDGPFDSPQNFNRINLLGKYSAILDDNSKFSVSVSRFSSRWDASGQIPQRLVDNGTISRFGSVDDTEGGSTSRTNINASLSKPIDENTFIKANAFYSKYDFELYSNFTFFLEDPINGDQIRQKENRSIYGMNAELNKKTKLNDVNVLLQYGIGFRADATTDTELSHTLNRRTVLENIKLGDIDESNFFSYVNSEFSFGKLMINPAVRLDYFKFNYQDKLTADYKTENKIKISPKLNFIYSQNNNLQFFIKSGIGFHSNDTRVVVQNSGKQILPKAIGTDVGIIWKPFPKLIVNSALWYLYLEQEFVYVGDAGIIEPSGKSKRMGFDLGLRYQLNDWLYFDTDANYTDARSIDEPKGQDYIPLAPDFTSTGGLSFQNLNGFSGGIHYRYLKSRPANEDNSIVAKGYFVSDFNINYKIKNISFGVAIENLFNTKWNETQFATESRLQNESTSVAEIHFTPGTPFFMKGKITYTF
ncbi:TonB-dependent receptor [Flavobacterium gawalongense]|uniref:TonB-dependent receptor n=1 Tax=Flavobacterium gawalongense TaxID=2594432 RepID=A0A553BBD3_9FLAO|nr:TonB-dependent receptor [Flavobacterium gawalongense]TRW97185.1 TonB-dependent receptor [Flavobacterium gawalongense]TRX02140.1 TonB-dependent receptor [Flavobacterium gawalongense]TRX05550.1 TonB-dependent receptor [Flavobacterium gawalongense]TRX06367.1 TonB-dependent receptor [Flavobacterium gawalongense]TRX21990.1 TonB-dependent receptor [Flavobacterium gawalongense]